MAATKKFALSGVIQFFGGDKAVKEVLKVKKAVGDLKEKAREGFDALKPAAATIGAAGIATAAGIGLAVKQAIDFEQGMANVSSVADGTAEDLKNLEKQALQVGMQGLFSATEAASGMEILTKAGLTATEVMTSLPGVLAAASTEGLNIAQSAEIVMSALRGANLQISDTTRVADTLAFVANKTQAGMLDMGEAMKYAANLAARGILSFDDLSAAIGLMSNAGLKGTIAGTSLISMFNQISKPSEKVKNTFDFLGMSMNDFTDASGKMRSIPEIIAIISKASKKLQDDMERQAFLSDFVGIEGAKAFSALEAHIGAFSKLRADIPISAAGFAAEVANKRLNTLSGALDRLKNRFSTVMIFFGKMFIPGLRELAEETGDFLIRLGDTFAAVLNPQRTLADLELIKTPLGRFINGFVIGFQELIDTAKEVGKTIFDAVKLFFPEVENSNFELGKLVAKFVGALAVVGPLVVALTGAIVVFGSLASGISGTISLVGVLVKAIGSVSVPFLGWVVAIGAVVTGLVLLYKNWDSVVSYIKSTKIAEFFTKIFTEMSNNVLSFINTIKTFASSLGLDTLYNKTVKAISDFSAEPMQSPTVAQPLSSQANAITQPAIEQKVMTAPQSQSQQPVNVSVNAPNQEITLNATTTLDGDVISKYIAKKAITNSQRRGQNITPTQIATARNGVFAQ